jgi:hypothetical protein
MEVKQSGVCNVHLLRAIAAHPVYGLQVNRCVRCANGTFSLNYSQPCHPCILGATCHEGLLQPAIGYWSGNPFVPQVLPCLLRGACASRNFSLQQLQALTTWVAAADVRFRELYVTGAVKRAQQAAAAPALQARAGQRGLLYSAAQGVSPMVGISSLNKSSSSSFTRNEALLWYNQQLASLLAHDLEPEGPPKLYAQSYPGLTKSWHAIQCNKGYVVVVGCAWQLVLESGRWACA